MPTYQTSQLEEIPIVKLNETLEDEALRSLQTQSHTFQGMMRGRKWFVSSIMHGSKGLYKDLFNYGDSYFRWVCNRSGGTLAQGALVSFYGMQVPNIDSGSVSSITEAGVWEAGEQVGNLVYILDDAGAAGAAPEGESRYIVKNTANIIYVQPDFTVAPAVGDAIRIISNCNVIAAAIGDDRNMVAGAVVNPDGIPDNYWGWAFFNGTGPALVLAATAMTAGLRLIADVGRVNEAAAPNAFEDIGYLVVGCNADIVSDLIPVKLELPV